MRMSLTEVDPPQRLLMGPGPVNAHPRVLRAMSAQLLGQFDPEFTAYMNETMAAYREVFETQNRWTFLIDGTARAAIEAALVSLLEPGDRVVIASCGRFGGLLTEIAERCGAEPTLVSAPWGEVVRPRRDRGRHRRAPAARVRLCSRRHLHHHGPADGRDRRRLPRRGDPVLRRRHGDHRRHAHPGRRLGRRRRHRRPAEMPRRAFGRGADHHLGPRRRADLLAPPCGKGPGRDRRAAGPRRAHRVQLFRPGHDHGLLVGEAAEPPHGVDHPALRRAGMRPAGAGGGARRPASPATPCAAARWSPGSRPWA